MCYICIFVIFIPDPVQWIKTVVQSKGRGFDPRPGNKYV